MNSVNFSNFRSLLDLWDNIKEDFNKKCIIEDNDLVFFFTKDKTIYGAPETSRITFAKMKNSNKDEKQWRKDATFSAYNLQNKENQESIFNYNDLDKIKVIDKEIVEKKINDRKN